MRLYFQQVGNPGYGSIGGEAPPPYIQDEPEEPAQRPDGQGVELPADGEVPVYNLVRLDAGGPPAGEPVYINLDQV